MQGGRNTCVSYRYLCVSPSVKLIIDKTTETFSLDRSDMWLAEMDDLLFCHNISTAAWFQRCTNSVALNKAAERIPKEL